MRRFIRTTASALGALALPRVCAVCDRLNDAGDVGVVCGRCWVRVVWLPEPLCDRCGHPAPAPPCRWCALLPPYVRAARSLCWAPDGVGGAVVRALKYDGWPALAPDMAARLARVSWPADVAAERRALVPVPLDPARERERGYNQSLLLAQALAPHWRCAVWPDVVRRTRATETQTRLTPAERVRNVAGAFRTTTGARARLRGEHVVLVDDVVTTAATLNSCAAALFYGGARVVSYITFGRARAPWDPEACRCAPAGASLHP